MKVRAEPRLSQGIAQLIIIIGFLAFLEFIGRIGFFRPTTLVPFSQMIASLGESVSTGEMLPHFLKTMTEILVSFAIGATLGIPIGILFWRKANIGKMFEPYLVALYALPLFMFYPVMLVIFGLGVAPIILVAATMSCVPVILNTMIGFSEIREVLPKLAISMNATRMQLYTKVLFPAATPFIATGLRMGVIYGLLGVIGMEFFVAEAGLGYLVYYTYNRFATAAMYASILLIVIIAVTVNLILVGIEQRIRKEMT